MGPQVARRTMLVSAALAARGTASEPRARKKGEDASPIAQVVRETLRVS